MGIDESRSSAGETGEAAKPRTAIRPAYLIILLLVIAGVGAWRWRDTGFDWRLFTGQFAAADPGWIATAFLLALSSYVGRAIRWQCMIPRSRIGVGFRDLFSATAIGFTATVFFGRAGEFVRPYLIAKRTRLPVFSQVAVWMVERLLDLLMVVILFGFSLSRLGGTGNPKIVGWLHAGGWALLVSGLFLTIPMGILWIFPRWSRNRLADALAVLPEPLAARARSFLDGFLDGLGPAREGPVGLSLLLLTILEWLVIVGCGYAVFQAFPGTKVLSPTDVVITLGVITLGNIIQIPGIGGGMQIATVFALTEIYQVSLEAATVVALALWVVNFLVIVPFGLVFAVRESLNWHKLRNLAPTEPGNPSN